MGLGCSLMENGSRGMMFKQKTEQTGGSEQEGIPLVNQNSDAGALCIRHVGGRKQEGLETLAWSLAFILNTVQGQSLAGVA